MAAILPATMSLVLAFIVMPQSGVMSLPPAGKSSVSRSAPFKSVPASVPVFCLWHEPHDPSVRLTESITTEPESRSPICVAVQENVSAPCASLPVPVQVPVRLAKESAGVVVVVVGAAGADADEPQPRVVSSAAMNSGARIFTLEYRSNVRDIFFSIHQGLPREGPGDRASTRRAFRLIDGLSEGARILDVGCGPGQQTIDLADLHRGSIVAIDTHRPYLDALRARTLEAGVAHRVHPLHASMFAVPLADGSVDAIWAEGSIYIVGFERGLRAWKRLLKAGGCVAATHVSWLTSDVPDEPRAFWARSYPAITTVEANVSIARACGFEVVDHFTLPESAWWDNYYGPMERRIAALRGQYRGDGTALAAIENSREQIALYRRYAKFYGYVFYVLQLRHVTPLDTERCPSG